MYGIICVITAEPKRPDTPERKSAIVIVPLTIAAAIDLKQISIPITDTSPTPEIMS